MSTLREPLSRRVREVTYLIHSHLVPREIQAKKWERVRRAVTS